MDTEMGNIDIEGKSLTCSSREIEKLVKPEGCELKMVTEKVHSLDDGSCSDQEDYYDEESACITGEAKFERLKREFISLTLNSNRDPIKPGAASRLKNFFEDQNNHSISASKFASPEDGCNTVHKRYKNLGSYDNLINNKEKGFEEISPGRVFKRKVVAGVGSTINDDSIVIYNCAFWNEGSSDPYDSTWLRHNTILTDLAQDSVLPGVRELLLTMKCDEWCEALIRPEAAFGPLGAPPRIPPNATIFCVLEIVKIVPKDKISRLVYNPKETQAAGAATFDDFYEASDEARKRGNYYLDTKQYNVALHRYKSGMRILEGLTYKNEQEETKAMSLLLKLYNNAAKAANAANIPRCALGFCKEASKINDREPKTYWHRLNAWKIKGHLDKALANARQAMYLFSKEPSTFKLFQREAESLKKRMQVEKDESDELYRRMGRAAIAS